MTWLEVQVAREITKERVEDGVRYAQYKAQHLGELPQPRRRINLLAALTRLFQGRQRDHSPAPKTNTQHQTI